MSDIVCVCFYCDTPLTWNQARITAFGRTTCGCVEPVRTCS